MRPYIHFTQPLFGKEEKDEVLQALDSGWVTLGPRTRQFEEDFAKYVHAKYAIGVTSATAGMHLGLVAAGVSAGDEVITTDFTFAASANVIAHVGAKPVLVDIDPRTFNIDPKEIEKKVSKKTKAIIPVHYGGQPVDMTAVLQIAKKHGLTVIEDAAHATGAEYKGKRIGSFGHIQSFSFHPIKNMSTGDGGMVTTNNKKYADLVTMLRLHGMSKDAWKRHSKAGSWKYDILFPGYKYNMTDIAAALGIHQLKKVEKFIAIRQKYAKFYDTAFADIQEITRPYVDPHVRHVYSLYSILIDDRHLSLKRDDIIDALKEINIGCSVYFIPLHLFSFYQKTYGYKRGDFPVAENVYKKIISLPLYPKMTEDDIFYVSEQLKKIILKSRKTSHVKKHK